MNIKAIAIHDVRNPGPDLGETQLYDGVELVNKKSNENLHRFAVAQNDHTHDNTNLASTIAGSMTARR